MSSGFYPSQKCSGPDDELDRRSPWFRVSPRQRCGHSGFDDDFGRWGAALHTAGVSSARPRPLDPGSTSRRSLPGETRVGSPWVRTSACSRALLTPPPGVARGHPEYSYSGASPRVVLLCRCCFSSLHVPSSETSVPLFFGGPPPSLFSRERGYHPPRLSRSENATPLSLVTGSQPRV